MTDDPALCQALACARRRHPAPAGPARAGTPFIADPVPAGLIPGEGTGLPWSLT